ncbi:hypothetical protein ES703_91524 [subsurface metagenome]
MFGQPNDDFETTIAFEHQAGALAPDRDLDDTLHIGDAQALSCQGLPVQFDREHGQSGDLLGLHVCSPLHALEHVLDLARHLQQRVQVVAEDLDPDVAANARYQLVETHLNRLGELIVVARHLRDDLFDLGDELRLGHRRIGPLRMGFEHDVGVGDVRRHRIGGHLRRADLGKDLTDLGHLPDGLLQLDLHIHGLRQARPRNAHRVRGDIAFIERGYELAAHTGRGNSADDHQRAGRQCDHVPIAYRGIEKRHIGEASPAHEPVLFLGHFAGHQNGNSGRNKGHRQDRGAAQRHENCQGHGREHLPFDARQRENREVDDRDDEGAE